MGSQNKDCHHRNTRTYGTRLVSPNGIIVCRSLFLHHSLTRLSPFISFPPYLLPPSWCTSYSEWGSPLHTRLEPSVSKSSISNSQPNCRRKVETYRWKVGVGVMSTESMGWHLWRTSPMGTGDRPEVSPCQWPLVVVLYFPPSSQCDLLIGGWRSRERFPNGTRPTSGRYFTGTSVSRDTETQCLWGGGKLVVWTPLLLRGDSNWTHDVVWKTKLCRTGVEPFISNTFWYLMEINSCGKRKTVLGQLRSRWVHGLWCD